MIGAIHLDVSQNVLDSHVLDPEPIYERGVVQYR